jgi:hypothetical protein
MRILFDNAARRSTITSTNELANYPPENLVSQFLEERWQEQFNSPPSAIITIAFDDPEDLDSLFFGYSNIDGIYAVTNTGARADLAISDDNEGTSDFLDDIVTSSGDEIAITDELYYENAGAIYWSALQTGVTSVVIYVFGVANPLYLGGIGIGPSYKMPNPVGVITEGFLDQSPAAGSVFGQSLQTRIQALREESYNFTGIKRPVVKEIWAGYLSVGVGGKVWLDVTENNHNFKEPMYCQITAVPATSKDGVYYSFSMSFLEAR